MNRLRIAPGGWPVVAVGSALRDTLTVWSSPTAEARGFSAPQPEHCNCLALAPDGSAALWRDPSGAAVHDLTTGAKLTDLDPEGLHVAQAAFSADGRTILAACLVRNPSGGSYHFPERPLFRLDARTGGVVKRWPHTGLGGIYSFAAAPDGSAVGFGVEQKVLVWEETGEASTSARGGVMTVIALSAGGEVAASAGKTVGFWKRPDVRKRIATLSHGATVRALAFSPDGKLLASAGDDGAVKLWEVPGCRCRATFDWGIDELRSVCFAPDGLTAAAGSRDGRVVVWDLEG